MDKIGKVYKYLIYNILYCFTFLLYDYDFRIKTLYFVVFFSIFIINPRQ